MAVGPTKFLTEGGRPLHPIVEREFEDDIDRVKVKALVHQDQFAHSVPPLDDEARYWSMSMPRRRYDVLPEGKYDIDEGGFIGNITAPSVDPAIFNED